MTRFALCVNSGEYEDIQRWKIYEVLESNEETDRGWLRVIDESGEDYLYPPDYFEFMELPKKIQEAMLAGKLS